MMLALNLKKTFCKQFYKLLVDKINSWFAANPWRSKTTMAWRPCCMTKQNVLSSNMAATPLSFGSPGMGCKPRIQNLLRLNHGGNTLLKLLKIGCTASKTTRDNKLRQFYFKLLHRIPVTNKELKCFEINDCVKCVMCGENDSIEHAFLECQSFLKLCDESLQWFNNLYKINVSLTPLQFFLDLPAPSTSLSNKQTKDFRLLLLYAKQCHYARKTMQKKVDTSEFISKL